MNNQEKSKTQEVAEMMLKAGQWMTTLDLEQKLGIDRYRANNVFYSIKKSARYDTRDKKIGDRNAIKVIKIMEAEHTNKKVWCYTSQEEQARLAWDLAIFGIKPENNILARG